MFYFTKGLAESSQKTYIRCRELFTHARKYILRGRETSSLRMRVSDFLLGGVWGRAARGRGGILLVSSESPVSRELKYCCNPRPSLHVSRLQHSLSLYEISVYSVTNSMSFALPFLS